jgi:hypothetical protein
LSRPRKAFESVGISQERLKLKESVNFEAKKSLSFGSNLSIDSCEELQIKSDNLYSEV